MSTGERNTHTTRNRLRSHLPHPWNVCGYRGATVLYRHGAAFEDGWLVDHDATIWPDGKVSASGGTFKKYLEAVRREDNERRRLQSRMNYWRQRAQGLYRDRSNCRDKYCGCHPRSMGFGQGSRPGRLLEGTCSRCGCRGYRKTAHSKLSVASIMAEENVAVRVSKMMVYGLERFLLEAHAKVISEEGGYQLLSLPLNHWRNLRALKMTCPSTQAVYLNMVPPEINTVRAGLNWMYDVPKGMDYLRDVGQVA